MTRKSCESPLVLCRIKTFFTPSLCMGLKACYLFSLQGTVAESSITALTSSSQTDATEPQPSRTPSTSVTSTAEGAPQSRSPSQVLNITTHHSQHSKALSQHSIVSRTSGVFSLHDIMVAERKEGEEAVMSSSSASSSSHSGSGSGSGGGLEGSIHPSAIAIETSLTVAGGEVQQDSQQEQQATQKKYAVKCYCGLTKISLPIFK